MHVPDDAPLPEMLSGKRGFTVDLTTASLAVTAPLRPEQQPRALDGTLPASHTLPQVGPNRPTYPVFTGTFIVHG